MFFIYIGRFITNSSFFFLLIVEGYIVMIVAYNCSHPCYLKLGEQLAYCLSYLASSPYFYNNIFTHFDQVCQQSSFLIYWELSTITPRSINWIRQTIFTTVISKWGIHMSYILVYNVLYLTLFICCFVKMCLLVHFLFCLYMYMYDVCTSII